MYQDDEERNGMRETDRGAALPELREPRRVPPRPPRRRGKRHAERGRKRARPRA